MALQVWLPLNGNLNNQGLTDITVINGGATVNNNGKIGKCYYFDGTDDYINLGNLNNYFDGSPFTICFWIKSLENATRGVIFSSYALPSGSNFFCIEVNSSSVTNNSLRFDWNSNPDVHAAAGSIPYDEWVHIAIVYNGTNATQIYKNGSLINTFTTTLTSLSSTNNFYLGRDSRTGATALNGYLNDFRIYDNALSPKEIEILSRGLVCHYPLNGGGRGGDNILKGTNLGKSGWTWSAASGSRSVETYDVTGVKMTVVEVGSSWNMWYFTSANLARSLQPDTDYTVSVDILPPQDAYINCGIIQTNSSNPICPFVTQSVKANKWNHLIFNLHSNSSFTASNQVVYMNGIAPDTVGKTIYLKNLKMELGTVATPWIPNPADSAYTSMGYSSTTEYDVSGYGYNGTKNGTFTYLTDTARYNVSTNIKGASSYIQIPNLTTTGFSNSYSFAWWGKVPSYQGYMMWGFSDGVRLNGIFNGNLWNTGDGANNPLYIPGTTTQVTVPTVNVWHHWVMTGDGTTCKVYQDGVLWGQAKTYKPISGTTIYLNGWDAGTSYTYGDYQMSDFRIYATALSATQIAELYNTAVSVVNNGTLMGYELVEG